MDIPASPFPAPRLGLGPVGISVRLVLAVAILVAAYLFAWMVVPAVLALFPAAMDVLSGQSPWGFLVAGLLQALVLVVVAVAVWAWMRWVERRPLRDAGWRWRKTSILWLTLGLAVTAATQFAVVALLPAVGPVLPREEVLGSAPLALALVNFLGLAFLQQAIPEELLFRGWLLSTLRARPVLAIAATTLTFTVIHLVSEGGQENLGERFLYLVPPFGFALLAVGLLLWTRSLWAAVGVHGGVHVGTLLAGLWLPEVHEPLAWVAVGGTHAVLGFILTATAMRRGRTILPDPPARGVAGATQDYSAPGTRTIPS